jgi:acyl carrier protein
MTTRAIPLSPGTERLGQAEVTLAVRTALAKTLQRPLEDIRPEADLEADLGLDSMSLIEVNIAIEEQLAIAVPAGETPELAVRTVDDFIGFVRARLAGEEESSC